MWEQLHQCLDLGPRDQLVLKAVPEERHQTRHGVGVLPVVVVAVVLVALADVEETLELVVQEVPVDVVVQAELVDREAVVAAVAAVLLEIL